MSQALLLVESLRVQFASDFSNAHTAAALEELRVRYLGKKSPIQLLMKQLRDVAEDQRPAFGKAVNDLKEWISLQLISQQDSLIAQEEAARIAAETIDISLPGRRRFIGNKHVITQMTDRVLDILISMGFSVQYGPDIDSEFYNFEALNMPEDHPARDMQDTFYIAPGMLLRTHTSNVQIRVMEANKPPIRIVAPGKVYRNEEITSRSHVFFHQVEALYIDEDVTFSDLFATLRTFLYKLFDPSIEIRFRPSFFPFVEPGMEVDIRCQNCTGNGCSLCKHSGWLEVLGAGMVHPEVLTNGGIDPMRYSAFAWGMGIDRLAMLKYGISDLRNFTQNDMRFLTQFYATPER